MEEPKSDFSKLMARQFQEEQLKDTIEKLKTQNEILEKKVRHLQQELKEREVALQGLEKKSKATIMEKSKLISELEIKLKESKEMNAELKKEANVLRAVLEEEKSKSLVKKLWDKLTGK